MVAHGTLEPGTRPCGTPLTTAHAHALLELRQAHASLNTTELAARLGIERTTCSRLCKRMIADGELQRTPHPEDGRAHILELTAHGKTLAANVHKASTAHFEHILEHLDDAEHTNVIDALDLLCHAISRSTNS